jgi:tetratricopeptide (TPR) repeat protein
MTRQQQLKNEARRAEHRSDWARAIELYKSAIRLEQESGSVSDVGVYNRVGDLYLRRGDTTAAVEYYEQAADHYAAHGLHTSAIALCNKVLRIAPERDEVYRRLARLHASTGLLAEARNAFLQFAQRMQDRDRLSEALEAIQELVGLTGAEELRTAFAGQLEAAGLASQAAAQLRLVYEARIAAGRNAQDIRERIVALDPAADPVTPAEAPSPRAVSTTPGPQRSAEEPPDEMRDLRAPGTPLPVDLGPTSPEPARDELQLEGPSTEVAAVSDAEVIPGADDDLASILSRFRSHVRGIVEETDHAVHYDLGVAYMGMGLLDEAIGEFQHAIHSPSLMEAAHALLGECLRSKASAKSSEAAPPATPPAVPPLAPPADRSTGTEVPTGEDDEGEDLAEQMFQARLAQHRVRRAAEQAKADHQAHLDLARAYEGMGLLLEAVRDYVAAAEGPGSVRDAALDALELLASSASVDAVALSEAMEALMAEGRDETAVQAGQRFVSRPGIREADRRLVGSLLPIEETPPAPEGEDGGLSQASPSGGLEYIPAGPDVAGVATDIDSAESTPIIQKAVAPDEPASLFGEAEALREVGRVEEAESLYYQALEMYEKAREARSAIRVVDRLLSLRPDDVVLHHQKTEFAITTNDRQLLIAACLDLAACLRRQNGFRSARTVYGRILDVDAHNAEARAGIAALDADELARERQRQQRPAPGPAPPSGTESESVDQRAEPAAESGESSREFDQMFDDLREASGPEEAEGPDYESHYELGVAFRQMQMWDEAAREFRLAAHGLREPLLAYELLGECLIELRRYEEARRILATAAAQPGEEADRIPILYLLGVAHLRAGDRQQARECLDRVVRNDSSHEKAAQLLSTLSR